MPKSRRLTISLKEDDYRKVAQLGKLEDRSLSWIITQAVREYLERHPVVEQLTLEAIGRRR